jgi:hypothetical protein
VGRGSKGLRSWKGPWLFSLSEFGPHERMRITRRRPWRRLDGNTGAAVGILGYMYLGSRYIVLGLRHCNFRVPSVCTYVQRFCNNALVPTITTDTSTSSRAAQSNPGVLPVSLTSISRFLQRLFSCSINLMLFAGPECYAALGHISSADGAGRPQSPVLCSDTQNV